MFMPWFQVCRDYRQIRDYILRVLHIQLLCNGDRQARLHFNSGIFCILMLSKAVFPCQPFLSK
jgi:hypothetical protein